ncbi:MAG: hypothetical protein AAFQ79_11605 [Pseudomonadota bacterium]
MSDLLNTSPMHSGADGPLAGPWESVVCPRRKGPPLRFKGVCLCQHSSGVAPDGFTITLWRRKTPGFVAAVTGPDGADARSDKTLSAVMLWLEDQCRQAAAGDPHQTVDPFLPISPRSAAQRQELRQLAGAALDDWDRLDHQQAEQEAREP